MSDRLKYSLLFAGIGALFFIPLLGGVHLFDWDEVNFAEISREMILLDDYLRIHVNFEPFWQKPPLFFWSQVAAMKLFGINEFSARLPNAIIGVFTLVILFNIGKQLYHTRFGLLWAGAYFGSVLPFLYFKSGIIDPYFNFFIFLGMYFFVLFFWKKEGYSLPLKKNPWTYLFWGGFFTGIAILTKGQTAFIIAGLSMFVFWVYQRFRLYISIPQFLFYLFSMSLVTLAWYGLETYKNGSWFIIEFNKYQYELFSTPDAGHGGFPGYHFVVLLIGCFPISIFAIRSFFKLNISETDYQKNFRLWMKILFWVVLILFTIVRSKIVHYSSMCYFPLSFLAAYVINAMFEGKVSWNRWLKAGFYTIGALYVLAFIGLPIIGKNTEWIKPLFDDPFAIATLEADVHWSGWEVIPGIFLLLVLLFSGWWISKNQLKKAFITLFGGVGTFVMLALIFIINNVEGYSQRAAIDFFKSLAGKDVYVWSHNYKSYADIYYFDKPKDVNPKSYDRDWIYYGDIDKDVYFVTKINKTEELEKMADTKEIARKNGFVFYLRKAKK